MIDLPPREKRISRWPGSLRELCRWTKLGPAPALLVTPEAPGYPTVLWLHGRGVDKEIDSARYAKLVRAGIAVAAIDLPGHGERFSQALQPEDAVVDLLSQALAELDDVIAALPAAFGAGFDPARMVLGGMSAGGMVSLRRLCEPHPFRAAAVECTAGDLEAAGPRFAVGREAGLDPSQHLAGWRPVPLLALHSEADEVVPVAGIQSFVARLRAHVADQDRDPEQVELITWPETGAPGEHLGFGQKSAEARQHLLRFLQANL